MKVLTIDSAEFVERCRELRRRFESSYGTPDLIVGIATGGEFVSRQFAEPFEPVEIVTRRRLGSNVKNGPLKTILKRLPQWASDLGRMAESRYYNLRWIIGGRKEVEAKNFEISYDLAVKLRELPQNALIALVDDAADSGQTLLTVRSAIQRALPDARIFNCVLTITRAQARKHVDVSLWDCDTLIRFPWSADVRS